VVRRGGAGRVSESILLSDSDDASIRDAAAMLDGWRVQLLAISDLSTALAEPRVRALLLTTSDPSLLRAGIEQAHARGIPVLVGCADDAARRRAVELHAEEWFRLPASSEEVAARVWSAVARGMTLGAQAAKRADQVEYENMLHDSLTGLPTLPVAIERSRQLFKERGELVVLYFNFVRYSKIEEIYGWEKLDAVLETTASAVREFLDDDNLGDSRVAVSFTNDDDFIFFHVPAAGVAAATEGEITEMVTRLQRAVGATIESVHGEDIAALFDI
jgi:GGDEF domain-containing protein